MNTIQSKINNAFKIYPDFIAAEFENKKFTYSEIENKSKCLYDILNREISGEYPRIVLLFKDRINYLISMTAVWLFKGVAVPLDISLPKGKIKSIIQNNDIDFIIYDSSELQEYFSDLSPKKILYSWKLHENAEIYGHFDYGAQYDANSPIYIYFTSGTTGEPKGVLGKNCSLEHFISWEINHFGIQPKTKFAQLTAPSFDPFLRDIFVPFGCGGTICFMNDYTSFQSYKFIAKFLSDNNINMFHCVPSLFHIITDSIENVSLNSLERVFLAGERISVSDCEKWYKKNTGKTVLVSLYGPTETTLAKMFHDISESDIQNNEIPLGRPIPDTNIYLLDENGCESQFGEICIETAYASFGYINKKLNENKFVDSPYHSDLKLYRTGDYGKMNPDGNIVFCGRKDRQIKISGISANLYAIERFMLSHTDMEQCFLKLSTMTNRIICYYTAQKNIDLKNLNRQLTDYYQKIFIPQKYIKIDQFPLNNNGKIDFGKMTENFGE